MSVVLAVGVSDFLYIFYFFLFIIIIILFLNLNYTFWFYIFNSFSLLFSAFNFICFVAVIPSVIP